MGNKGEKAQRRQVSPECQGREHAIATAGRRNPIQFN